MEIYEKIFCLFKERSFDSIIGRILIHHDARENLAYQRRAPDANGQHQSVAHERDVIYGLERPLVMSRYVKQTPTAVTAKAMNSPDNYITLKREEAPSNELIT